MRDYHLKLEAKANDSNYYIKRAANSVDLNISKKLTHEVSINGDLESPYNIGLIIGNSGSGKTTFAEHIFGKEIFKSDVKNNSSIIEQFNDNLEYDERAKALSSIGLNSIPCWIKPFGILSNGEKTRAEIALRLSKSDIIGVDEFTSVVDRNIAKIMSHSIQRFVRKNNKKIICLSPHRDIVEWLNPDWIIDMNDQIFIDRRLLWKNYQRKEKLKFDIREVGRETWKHFSKYHYLSDRLCGGKNYLYGLFLKDKQIGFMAFSNYVPHRQNLLHSNRIVILPEYTGFGLGLKMVNLCSELLLKKGFDIWIKMSNISTIKSCLKSSLWKLKNIKSNFDKGQIHSRLNKRGRRMFTKSYSFKFMGNSKRTVADV